MPYIVQVSICSILFYIPYLIFLRGGQNHIANRWYLILSVVFSFIIPILTFPLYTEYVTIPLVNDFSTATNLTENWVFNATNFLSLITGIYWIGVSFQLALFFYGIFNIAKLVQQGNKIVENKFTKIITSENHPVSSFVHFIFIPKDRIASITEFELEHEACHVQQRHSIDILLIEIAKTFLWFNPIIYLVKKEISIIHEYLADQYCINIFGQFSYKEFLISQVTVRNKPVLIHTFNSLFKQRIQMIHSSKSISNYKYLMVLPFFLVSLFLFSFTTNIVYEYEKTGVTTGLDTIIPDGIRMNAFVDTVITFDPTTGKEKVEIVKRKITYSNEINPVATDTIVVFDPATGSETVHIVHKKSPTTKQKTTSTADFIDTVTVFDPETFKETRFIINNATGKRDTTYLNQISKKVNKNN